MSNGRINWQVILMVCICGLLVLNAFVSAKIVLELKELQVIHRKGEQLPCGAVPTRFVIEEPECANKLLKSMNITNVHILPTGAFYPQWNKTNFGLQNVSEKK